MNSYIIEKTFMQSDSRMSKHIIDNKQRESEGLPKIRFSKRGVMHSTPRDIFSSDKGKALIQKLSKLDLKQTKTAGEAEVL